MKPNVNPGCIISDGDHRGVYYTRDGLAARFIEASLRGGMVAFNVESCYAIADAVIAKQEERLEKERGGRE